MLCRIINTMLSGAILNGGSMDDAYRLTAGFVDLVVPHLLEDQRDANADGSVETSGRLSPVRTTTESLS